VPTSGRELCDTSRQRVTRESNFGSILTSDALDAILSICCLWRGQRHLSEIATLMPIASPEADAATITRLFEVFATGHYSLKALAAKARAEGWTIRGRRLHKSYLA
jgi:hypothetical protein